MPGNLRVLYFEPAYLAWNRPSNIPPSVLINYTVTINSSASELGGVFTVTADQHFSIGFLERVLSGTEECVEFQFRVVAIVAGTEDSVPALVMETVPLCESCRFICTKDILLLV